MVVSTAANPEIDLAFAAARTVCRQRAKNFYLACVFLPRPKRNAAYAALAFCQLIQDAIAPQSDATNDAPPAEGASSCCSGDSLDARLGMLNDRFDAIYDDRLELPRPEFRDSTQNVLAAFAHTARRYEIPRQYLQSLVEGCRADQTISRYATWSRLEKQSRLTFGAVGSILSCILGLRHSDANDQLMQLAVAMRLTNILRDLQRDGARGKIYLPLEDMARFRYSERDLANESVNDHFIALMRFEIDRARKLYRDGAEGLCWLADDGSRLSASAIVVTHSGILNAIERRDYDVFTKRAGLTKGQEVRRLARAWRLAKRGADEPAPDVFR